MREVMAHTACVVVDKVNVVATYVGWHLLQDGSRYAVTQNVMLLQSVLHLGNKGDVVEAVNLPGRNQVREQFDQEKSDGV